MSQIKTIGMTEPNTFLPWWTVRELRAWLREHSYRARHYPDIYRHSGSRCQQIGEELRSRGLQRKRGYAPKPLAKELR